jgi:hypothetical protein
MKFLVAAAAASPVLLLFQLGLFDRVDHFEPSHRLDGIGLSREKISDAVLERRTEQMIESQTFAILRDPEALTGAQRVNSPTLKKIFANASQVSGLPESFIAAIAYLESWGEARAVSPAGPKGIMQISHGTARAMGLRITYARRYRTVTQRRKVRSKGKVVTRTVRRRVPYTVLVRDDRMVPSRAVPAAAKYMARLEERYGGRDWAVWAYHCGEGCTAEVRDIASRSEGIAGPVTVPKVFFAANPARNRSLYEALRDHMDRDYSPTYWFRIRRAEQLLELYRKDPSAFRKLYAQYRNPIDPVLRAPHRLAVWLTPDDLAYRSCEDLKREAGRSLVRAFDDPDYFGFSLRLDGQGSIGEFDFENREYFAQASPSVIGTIAYIAYETRRLHAETRRKDEKFVPLEITSLVQPRDYEERHSKRPDDRELPAHCSGQVFDVAYGNLPPGQREALEFVLNDLGWSGYLGFVRDEPNGVSVYHVGASPTARDFFASVYADALEKTRTETD